MTIARYTLDGTVCMVVRVQLLEVKWLGLGVTVRVMARDGKWISFLFFSVLEK